MPYLDNQRMREHHPIFKNKSSVLSTPLVDGAFFEKDPLLHIHIAKELSQVCNDNYLRPPPLILSPSRTKILYANPLKSLWYGLQETGGVNFGLGIIGYSLPNYDEYAKQALYHLIRNYTEYEFNTEMLAQKKTPVKILDYNGDYKSSNWQIRKNYSFVNWNRCELNTSGLNVESIDWLMRSE